MAVAQQRALALRGAGNLAAARELLNDVVESVPPSLGKDHPDALSTAHLLARLHREADDPSAARRVLEEAFAAGERRWPHADPLMLALAFELGSVADELGNRHEARRNYTRVAAAGPAVLGADHPAVRTAREYLGDAAPAPQPAVPAPRQPEPAPMPAHGVLNEPTISLAVLSTAWKPHDASTAAGSFRQPASPFGEGVAAPSVPASAAPAVPHPRAVPSSHAPGVPPAPPVVPPPPRIPPPPVVPEPPTVPLARTALHDQAAPPVASPEAAEPTIALRLPVRESKVPPPPVPRTVPDPAPPAAPTARLVAVEADEDTSVLRILPEPDASTSVEAGPASPDGPGVRVAPGSASSDPATSAVRGAEASDATGAVASTQPGASTEPESSNEQGASVGPGSPGGPQWARPTVRVQQIDPLLAEEAARARRLPEGASPASDAVLPGDESVSGAPASGPPSAAAQVSGPQAAEPASGAPSIGPVPVSAPPASGPTAPPTSGAPTSSPPISGPPRTSPPTSALPVGGSSTSGLPTSVLPVIAPPVSGPSSSTPPTSAPPAGALPVSAPPTSGA
ncbi:tetratricopeptide repeat protein, partial [Verrucosispora sp. SN26_14.1]